MEADLRDPQYFHRSACSSKLEEVSLYTQIGLCHVHPGPVHTGTNNKQRGSARQVAQGMLHTMSDIDLYLNHTQVDPEPAKPGVGFRPHQSSA